MKRGKEIFIILLVVFVLSSCTAEKDIVGFAGSTLTTCSTPDKFSVTEITGCDDSRGKLFCPQNVYIKRCMDDNGQNVLNYCMNGFCGNRVLDLDFEQNVQNRPVDASGAHNTILCASCPSSVTLGRQSKSIRFSGAESVELSNLGLYIPPQFTILGWVKPDAVSGERVIMTNKDNTGAQGFDVTVDQQSGEFGISMKDSTLTSLDRK